MSDSKYTYNLLTKWLHFGIAISITIPLLFSIFMDKGGASLSFPLIAYDLHKFIGLNALLLVSLYLLWSAERKAKTSTELFPWFSLKQIKILFTEFKGLFSKSKNTGTKSMAAAVQGLGITFALVATTSGLYLIMGVIFPSLLFNSENIFIVLHAWSSNALWGYLALHLGAALWHIKLRKRKQILKIFDLLERRNDIRPKIIQVVYKKDENGVNIANTENKKIKNVS